MTCLTLSIAPKQVKAAELQAHRSQKKIIMLEAENNSLQQKHKHSRRTKAKPKVSTPRSFSRCPYLRGKCWPLCTCRAAVLPPLPIMQQQKATDAMDQLRVQLHTAKAEAELMKRELQTQLQHGGEMEAEVILESSYPLIIVRT
jgi:hypothetical protein